jgi:predicted phage terminase large subunit-like protein
MPADSPASPYAVGPGRPPLHTRFKKGQSGNPQGRPRRSRNLVAQYLVRRRMDYPELKRAVRAEYERSKPDVVLIEDRASGTQLIQELVAEGIYAVTSYRPQGDKVMRLHAQTATIENGFVHLPQAAPWLGEYLHELAKFPYGRFDDQADATAQFLDWFKS